MEAAADGVSGRGGVSRRAESLALAAAGDSSVERAEWQKHKQQQVELQAGME